MSGRVADEISTCETRIRELEKELDFERKRLYDLKIVSFASFKEKELCKCRVEIARYSCFICGAPIGDDCIGYHDEDDMCASCNCCFH